MLCWTQWSGTQRDHFDDATNCWESNETISGVFISSSFFSLPDPKKQELTEADIEKPLTMYVLGM